MGIFSWIRHKVKAAVLAGFGDAVEQLGVDDRGDEESSYENLRLQLVAAQPVPEPKPTKSSKKAG